MPFTIDLSGKTVVITGISSGIGAGIAKMYAKANANIAGCGQRPPDDEKVEKFRQTVHEESGKMPLYYQADVTKIDQLDSFVNATVREFGGIDILASNAGTNIFRGAATCTREDWLRNMNLNLESHWNIAKLCKPHLEKNNGVIIINSSSHSHNTIPGSFPYNIAKTALTALIQSFTVEWGPKIRALGVAPGFIDTHLADDWFATFPDPAKERENTEKLHPLNRIGTPEEIGGWFVFLSSEYAAFAGGQTYLIDGGRSCLMM